MESDIPGTTDNTASRAADGPNLRICDKGAGSLSLVWPELSNSAWGDGQRARAKQQRVG
jgi:hypothetical protein